MKFRSKRPHRGHAPRTHHKLGDITKKNFEGGSFLDRNGDSLGGAREMVVVVGPEMSEKEAVEVLERLVRRIKKDGLLTDRCEYVFETVDGKLFV